MTDPIDPVAEARPATAVDILTAARDLISDRNRWTTGYLARDANGDRCGVSDGGASCWCAEGAVYRASDALRDGSRRLESEALVILADAVTYPFGSIPAFNDATSHADVLALFDRAISTAKET